MSHIKGSYVFCNDWFKLELENTVNLRQTLKSNEVYAIRQKLNERIVNR